MRVACIGGGPGGLFTAILLKAGSLADEVTVYERNGPDDTFGFGIVFSDETFDNVEVADPVVVAAVAREFRRWEEIDILFKGRRWHSVGHGFQAMPRLRFNQLLAERASALGVDLRFNSQVTLEDVGEADLIVAADGANSDVRTRLADTFQPHVEPGKARYAWFGTPHLFDSFTFIFEETPHGIVQAHCYPYSDRMSTLIVETDDDTWHRAGLDNSADRYAAPGETDEGARAFTEKLFGKYLNGSGVVGNNSKWVRFPRISNRCWHSGNVVLLGDALHTAHFSIGSGTKLAMEDSIALTDALAEADSVADALAAYEESRRPEVESLQRAAATSRRWFESVDRYFDLDDPQFVFQLMTRSQRITYDNLQLRDPELMTTVRAWFHGAVAEPARPTDPSTPPMFYPFQLREMDLGNRVGVSPMAQYCALDGIPTEWHLVHLGSRAVGGAGLVMTEMACVSPQGRITPGCAGMWNRAQQQAWAGVVDFVHANSNARIGMQLGHAGRKGSTKVPWEADGSDEVPLDEGNWPLLAPSPIPWRPHSQPPRQMTVADMQTVRDEFVAATRRAADAGFDILELHMAHGYLLSSFLSPLTNQRGDAFGGDLAGRARYPLSVFDAVRAVWPQERPMSVRISAVDWMEGGNSGDDAVALAAMLAEHGCDIVDVSTGQVHPDQEPDYGRLYQTPFSDRIRLEVGIPTMTVGAVSSVDDVNTVVLAGRADICLLARSHLVDPYWTLNAAIDQGYAGHRWPDQYLSGKAARRRDQEATMRIEP